MSLWRSLQLTGTRRSRGGDAKCLAGTYGDSNAGDPIQSDELRIEHDEGDVGIVVYNRAVLLFRTDSEAVWRIHQVCCRLDDIPVRH